MGQVNLIVYANEDLKGVAVALARQDRVSVSEFIRRLIEAEASRRQSPQNPTEEIIPARRVKSAANTLAA